MSNQMKKQVGAALCMAMFASTASADIYTFGLYNHPDGSAAPPQYGLRLDGLDGNAANDFTFDFEDSSITNQMTLVLDTDTSEVTISGQVYGGQDVDDEYIDTPYRGLWNVDFTYKANVTFSIGSPIISIEVTGDDHANNTGTIIKDDNASLSFDLQDEQGDHSYSFKFNNSDDHRFDTHGLAGPDDFAGRGWLNHAPAGSSGSFSHVYYSDWLFVGRLIPEDTTIPVPTPTAALAAVPTLGLLALRKRRHSK